MVTDESPTKSRGMNQKEMRGEIFQRDTQREFMEHD